jgi:hypothetical protein
MKFVIQARILKLMLSDPSRFLRRYKNQKNTCQFPTLQMAETISNFTPSFAFTQTYMDGYRSPACAGVRCLLKVRNCSP